MSITTATETAATEYPRLPTIRSRVTDFPQCTFPKYVVAVLTGLTNGTIPTAPPGRGRAHMDFAELQRAVESGKVGERSTCEEVMRHVTWVRG
ncbi:Protein of unknown function [Pyronema omphalodes CBS 100304]|uniref:Uncharacterized protein n=1 Tax=Pyronema omphalodes (strain CBS 100304) TaxID=1076935 RepID=U4L7Z8_PYROM|nr:Protein of unknown function [Pyronema omphalodes CBS 100304]